METKYLTAYRIFSGIARIVLLLVPLLSWVWFIHHDHDMTVRQFAQFLAFTVLTFWLGIVCTGIHYHSRGYFQE